MKIDINFKRLIDPLKSEELTGLEQKILNEGFKGAVVVWKEQDILIDGHNRVAICEKHGIEYAKRYVSFEDRNAAINWIIDNQLSRRNLSPNQMSYLRGKKYIAEKQKHGGPRQKKQGITVIPCSPKKQVTTVVTCAPKKGGTTIVPPLPRTREKIAAETNVSPPTIVRDGLYAQAVDNISDKLDADRVKFEPRKDVITLAKKPVEEQERIIEVIKKENIPIKQAVTVAKRDSQRKAYELKKEEIKQKIEIKTNLLPNLILCDPPWRYDFAETTSRKIENQYDTLTVPEMKDLLPKTEPDCVLLLWATAPKIREAFELLDLWGFTYKSQAIWDKKIIGSGYWWRGQHEILIAATKGKPSPPLPEFRVSSVFREKRTKHSKKPVCVYEWIEKAFADKVKLEMFCREKRKNWLVMGDEV